MHPPHGSRRIVRAAPLMIAPLLLTGVAVAAEDDDLEQIILVANRAPVAADKVGNSVTVLDEQQIHDSQAVAVSDLLAATPGVEFARNGGPGALTSVFVRGANSDQTLVLVDGVQLNDPSSTGGGFDFGNLLVGDISRIEVLRGSQSTLYGSQAIGGVINLVTRESEGSLSGNAQAEVGSQQTSLLKGGVGGAFDRFSFRVGAGYYDTQGVSAQTANTEPDPFHNLTFNGRVGFAFTPDVRLDLRSYYSDGKYNYDGAYLPDYSVADVGVYGRTRQLVDYSGLNVDLFGGALSNRIAFQYTGTDRGNYYTSYSGDSAETHQLYAYSGVNQRYEYQGTWKIASGWQAVFGAQREALRMTSAPYSPTSAKTSESSLYAQLQAEVAQGLTLTAGERYDDHETFGSHSTGQLAAAWALPSHTVLRASWGQGFKAPSLYQLYASYYGNPALKPEQSDSWDTGIEQRWGHGSVTATYFSRHSTNLITYDPFTYVYYNTAKAQADGVELSAELRPTHALTLSANYTNLRTIDKSPGSDTYGLQLLRRPKSSANVGVTYQWPVGLKTGVTARYSSGGIDQDFNDYPDYPRVQLDSYTLVDLRVAYPLLEQKLELYGRVENLFDKDYATVLGYGTLGRATYVGVSAKF
ncbi:MAG: TonB-dependent receptor [Steroidobacteraceae bacterium]